MTGFIQFVLNLFEKNGYDVSPNLDTDKPLFVKIRDKYDYWFVAEGLSSFKNQADVYKWFKSDFGKRFPVAEKNISLLLLVDMNRQQEPFDEVEIENDPLYFKKYVLTYDDDSYKELKNFINQNGEDFESLIMNDNTFDSLIHDEPWAKLLYSIVHKLPFIPTEVESQQVEQQTFAFKTPEIAELFDSLSDLPSNLDNEDAISFINNYLNADNNEEH